MVIILDAEVRGRRTDVAIRDGVVAAVGESLPRAGFWTFDARGGALLPGLHDHHVHLNAMAAERRSVTLDATTASDPGAVARLLREGVRTRGWIRATQYHEDMAGDLDCWRLDSLLGPDLRDVPVRVQHRSGALWVLNSAALRRLGPALTACSGAERDERGELTGRLWRSDEVLRSLLAPSAAEHAADLTTVARHLLGAGVTGVTDATPDLGGDDLTVLQHVRPLRVVLMAEHAENTPPWASWGPRKIVIGDHDLPTLEQLVATVRAARGRNHRAVAIHSVSLESLVLVLAALTEVGPVPGDRIEHGALVPDALAGRVAELGLVVVTQPDFLRVRGAAYRRYVPAAQLPDLYRHQGLREHGIDVVVSSDAPYASSDPWQVIRSAVERRDHTGTPLAPLESVSAAQALDGYLRDPLDLAAPARRVAPGAPADLCLLDRPLRAALSSPSSDHVRATWVAGELVHLAR